MDHEHLEDEKLVKRSLDALTQTFGVNSRNMLQSARSTSARLVAVMKDLTTFTSIA